MPRQKSLFSVNKSNQLRDQLAQIGRALKISEIERGEQKEQLSDLGKRLNIELARKVNDLERYRSEFFGRPPRDYWR